MSAEAGRDPATMDLTLMNPKGDLDKIRRLEDQGVTRMVAMLPVDSPDKTMAAIDRWADILRKANA